MIHYTIDGSISIAIAGGWLHDMDDGTEDKKLNPTCWIHYVVIYIFDLMIEQDGMEWKGKKAAADSVEIRPIKACTH